MRSYYEKTYLIILALLILSELSFAQNWTFVEDFAYGSHPHGVVVTLDGKVWVGYFLQFEEYITAEGDTLELNPIWIYNPDGTIFKKIYMLTYNSKEYPLVNRCRGLSLDNNGNVLFTSWDTLWKINYKTYEAMNMITPKAETALTEAACDKFGNIYITYVIPDGKPIYIYNKNFKLKGYVDENVTTIQRSIVVTPNGKNVFVGKIYDDDGMNGIVHYRSKIGPEGIYEKVANYHPEIWGQCLDVDLNGLLWVGSFWNVGENDLNGWYALDYKKQFAIVNQIGENVGVPPYEGPQPPISGTYYAPRGATWSWDGKTLYTADFDGGVIKKWQTNGSWKKSESNSSKINRSIPTEYELFQNYPNPFNPTTTISFSIPESGYVTLKVYDMLGKEVAELVNDYRSTGTYNYQFDASKLSSGVYIYKLQAGNFIAIKKLTLMK